MCTYIYIYIYIHRYTHVTIVCIIPTAGQAVPRQPPVPLLLPRHLRRGPRLPHADARAPQELIQIH